MNRRKLIPLVAITALSVILVTAALVYRTVLAQAPNPTATPASPGASPNAAAPAKPGGQKGFRAPFMGGVSDTDLAAALGISVDKLSAAYQLANSEALKEAVSKGLLTQAQADQMASRMGSRPLGGFGRMGANGIDYNVLLANALGIGADKLKAAEQQVFTTNLDNAVKSGKLTQAQADSIQARNALANDSKFQSSLQEAYKAALQQAVTDGVITQAQADQILQQQSGAGGAGFGPGMFGGMQRGFPGFGFPGPNGRGMFHRGQNQPAQPAPTTPPASQ